MCHRRVCKDHEWLPLDTAVGLVCGSVSQSCLTHCEPQECSQQDLVAVAQSGNLFDTPLIGWFPCLLATSLLALPVLIAHITLDPAPFVTYFQAYSLDSCW